jgi:hypothetical protein
MAAAALAHAQTPTPKKPVDQPVATAPTAEQQDAIRKLPDKIKDKLTAEGFSDVTVVPGSFIVSGKDKDGKSVMMLIGPNSMSVMTTAQQGQQMDMDDDKSIAQSPANKDSNGQDGMIQQ